MSAPGAGAAGPAGPLGPAGRGPGGADPVGPDDADTRTRVLAAAVDVAGTTGLGRLTVEEVSRAAEVSRATFYRHFPGGREQLVSEAVTWEVARFFATLVGELDGIEDLPTRLEQGLIRGRALLAEHEVFQKVVDTEPERLLPHLSQSAPLIQAAVRDHLRPLLERAALRPGVDPEAAADWLARNVLSFLMTAGSWDLDDPAEVRRLVRGNLLAGVLA